MRILTIPDIHGRSSWQQLVADFITQQPDANWRAVFLGDYTDSFNKPDARMFAVVQEVVALKQQHPDNVVLLLGNHDWHYLYYTGSPLDPRCSGFRPQLVPALHAIYHEHQALFQVAWQYHTPTAEYLFVHAGVSRLWLNENAEVIDRTAQLAGTETLADTLNALLQTGEGRTALWQVSRVNGGYDAADSPVWVRPGELGQFVLGGYVQVVGHPPIKGGILRLINTSEETGFQTGIIFTDCMHDGDKAEKNEFLTLTL